MATLMLDEAGDLDLTAGRFTILRGADETAQRLKTKFRLFLGEWFLDTTTGVPWYETILGVKNPNLVAARALVRQIIVGDEGIAEAGPITLDYNASARSLSVSFEATTVEGQPLSFADLVLGGA